MHRPSTVWLNIRFVFSGLYSAKTLSRHSSSPSCFMMSVCLTYDALGHHGYTQFDLIILALLNKGWQKVNKINHLPCPVSLQWRILSTMSMQMRQKRTSDTGSSVKVSCFKLFLICTLEETTLRLRPYDFHGLFLSCITDSLNKTKFQSIASLNSNGNLNIPNDSQRG